MPPPRIVKVGGSEADNQFFATLFKDGATATVKFVTPADAVKAVAAAQIELLLVDLLIPGADVLMLLGAAAEAKDGGVPVVVTAPAAASERVAACLKRGAYDYLATPFDPKFPLLVGHRLARILKDTPKRSIMSISSLDATETAVLRFVPSEFLKYLERKSLADVKLGDHVQRDMTVFFTDIRDFTQLSEELTPQQNFQFLNSYLQHVNPIIQARNGFIDKYIGDAIMALFSDGADAVQAAIDLQQQVVVYNDGRRAAGYKPIRIGIGLHRGSLILGTIGEGERMQTTVIADAVNVASRIEGLTKTFGVSLLIGGTIVDGLLPGHPFRLRHLGAVKAKGKTKSVEIYECYDSDHYDLLAAKDKYLDQFAAGMAEFRKGMFLTAGKIFSRIAELVPNDTVAAYYRDRCTLTAVHGRGSDPWDGAERIEVK